MTRDAPIRGSIWWADPDPIVGSEIAKRRPVVVLSRDLVNARRRTVIAIPLSSRSNAHPPITVPVSCRGRDVIAVVDQVRAIDKSRLQEYIETMPPDDVDAIRAALDDLI